MSQTYANQVITDSSTGAVLTFSNIQVGEVDSVGPGLSAVETASGAVLPIAGFQAFVAPGSTAQDGLQWSGFTDIVAGGVASVTLTFSYTVTVSSAATITGLQQGFVLDQNSGNAGNVAQAVETITDSNGNAVTTSTLSPTAPSAATTLATGYTTLNVTDVLTVSVNDPGDTYTNYAFIGVSAIEQSFLLTVPASSGPNPVGGGGGVNDGGGGGGTPGAIVLNAFLDTNGDGIQETGELGVNAVAVTLENASGVAIDTSFTDGSGVYTFTNLTVGNYTVVFGPVAGDVATTPITDSVTVTSGGTVTENAGFAPPASFTTTVYTDANGDSLQNNGETGLAGVTVDLEDGSGNVVQVATTDVNGNVAFTGLAPGSYEVAVVAPGGDVVTQQTNVATVNTLAPGGTANAVEGVYVPATINGTAFLDANGDQTQDNGEAGIPGVTVTLLNGTTAVETATTNATGGYSFTDVAPGSYTVSFTPPTGDLATTPVSDAVTVASGGTATENAGFAVPASISGTTFIDNNDNGTLGVGDTDLSGVTVTLLNGTTTVGTETTDANGAYSFTGLAPGSYTVDFSTMGGLTATTVLSDTVSLPSGGAAVENAGYVAPASFTTTVYTDANGDSSQDNGETGLAGVTVNLENAGGTIEATAVTNSSGNVAFTGLTPGSYEVAVVTPTGDAVTQHTNVVTVNTLASGGTANAIEGVYVPATINAVAFGDTNDDGKQDNGETGLAGVTVSLLSGTTIVATATTNSAGAYSFTGVAPGSYTVNFSTPGTDTATTPVSDAVTVTSGGTASVTAGFYAPVAAPTAAITGTTFIDKNHNGTLDCGDTDLSGVTVTLLSGTTTVGTTTTNSSGAYSFTGEKAGTYTVVFTTPAGDVATTPVSDTVTLAAGGLATENAGFVAPGAIVGTAFMDNNDNGTLDCGDTDLSGVTVTLKNASGTVVGTTTTNSSGAYSFTGEQPGTYTVVFTTPTGDTATTPVSDTVTVTSGGTVTENAGFYQPSAIVGTAFSDKNGDGTQDNGETGLAGVTVTLKNSCGTVVGTTTTNATGGYSFTGEKAGTYTVVFTTPNGDMATTSVSDAVTLTAGGTITENAGFTVPASITGTTFADNNDNGVLDAGDTDLSGVTVTLKSGTTTVATTTTNSSGAYSFTGEKAGTYTVVFSTPTGDTATTSLSDTVTLTSGGSAVENAGYFALAAIKGTAFSDKNGNCSQDSGETGLAGVTVTLKNSSGTVVGTTTTNSSGAYSFTGEKPGTYTVVFTTPSGDVATTSVSDSVTLTAGGTITENAGFYASCGNNGTASITGEVWNDVNATGTLNCGESGLSGVTVDLLNSTGTAVLATTTTNSSGNFSFGKLSAGSYEIKVIAPTGDTFSPEASGSCGSLTSTVSPSNGVSSVITLSSCGSATVDAGVHAIISFASGCGTGGGGCGGGGYGGGGCGGGGSSESSNTSICGWDDGCEDNGGYGNGYGSCWTYDSGCGDYHNESGCSGQSASTSPITPFTNIGLADTANVAVKITLTGLNGVVTDADGTLSGKGLTKTGVGTYTLASTSAATMTAEMQALVFTPTANQVAPGQTVTTGFDVVATDANGYSDSDATTKVTVTATDSAPTLTQQTINCSVGDGGTLQGLWSQILANCHDSDIGNQAKITICSVGQSNTCGFLNYNASSGLLTYTADDCASGKTDAFTYTVADPDGVTCTGTVDIAVTGGTAPTTVSTSCNSTLTVSNSNGCFESLGTSNKLNVSGSGNQVYGGGGSNTFTVTGANNTIHGGSSNDTINLSNSGNTAVLSLGGCDTINGASLTNGTKLNLDTVLAQCDVQGATLSNISQYFSVACSGSNATLLYNGPGCGSGGSAVAVLNGIGYNTSLTSLVSHNVLQV